VKRASAIAFRDGESDRFLYQLKLINNTFKTSISTIGKFVTISRIICFASSFKLIVIGESERVPIYKIKKPFFINFNFISNNQVLDIFAGAIVAAFRER
jgi:hypothetical protein